MMRPKLFGPRGYWQLNPLEKAKICNGCGPGGVLAWLIPDTVWGLDITEACNIHDYMYVMGKTEADRNEADRVFRNNMIRLVDHAEGNWLIRKLRLYRVRTYYFQVSQYGGPYFWDGKNPSETMQTI